MVKISQRTMEISVFVVFLGGKLLFVLFLPIFNSSNTRDVLQNPKQRVVGCEVRATGAILRQMVERHVPGIERRRNSGQIDSIVIQRHLVILACNLLIYVVCE
jgi:hypothetical protein